MLDCKLDWSQLDPVLEYKEIPVSDTDIVIDALVNIKKITKDVQGQR